MIQIGHLQVSLDNREIRSNGESLRIGSRAFDILELLIRANGALVSKNEIMRSVWPNSVVEENNLQVHVAALRKALAGDRDLIRTVPGRGYRLVAPRHDAIADATMQSTSNATAALDAWAASKTTRAAPSSVALFSSMLVGRQNSIVEIIGALETMKIVTLVGAGGIGKTCTASEVAQRVRERFHDGVVFVPLASVSDRRFALYALASALGMSMPAGRLSLGDIVASLTGRRMLIVLDNCEHLIDVAAHMASALVASNASLRVLATSREALRVPEELRYHVPPLDLPDERDEGDAILEASAVELFVTRARATDPQFPLDARSVQLIALVCRRLDGIPLAIELAAARAAVLGVDVLNDHLDDHFRILTGGFRTALPRHQTLKATFDWSYRLLDDTERKLLRWLGVFINGFSFDAAFHVVEACGFSQSEVVDALGGLVSKSLVIRECVETTPRYRLLEITRAYARQRLEDFGECKPAALAHAHYFQSVFSQSPCLRGEPTPRAWLARLRSELGNLRAALDWAFSPDGDRRVGVELAAVAVPFFFDVSLVDECCERARIALTATLDPEVDAVPSRVRLWLLGLYAAARMFTVGPVQPVQDVWTEVLSLATAVDDQEYQLFAMWGLWAVYQYRGEARDALRIARRFCRLAETLWHPTFRLIGKRIEADALHYAGEAEAARAVIGEMLSACEASDESGNVVGFRLEHSIAARATLARVFWTQGKTEAALDTARRALDEALEYEHDIVTCYVLAEAFVPVALLTQSLDLARDGIALLRTRAKQCGFAIWMTCAAAYDEYLHSVSDPDPLRLARFRDALDAMRQNGYRAPLSMLLAQYAISLRRFGHFMEAAETVNEALRRCETTGERWFYPELRRLAVEIVGLVEPGKRLHMAALFASANAGLDAGPSGGERPAARQRGHADRGVGAARPLGAMCYRLRQRTIRSENG
jgi:predicted ATPase/DNA-binding winged helix-turn-helix (wHTH) protein